MNRVRQESHLTWYEVWGPIIPLLLWMNLAGTHEVFAANEAKPIQVIPHSVLIERLNGADPLPRSRPPQRLDEDGITDAAAFFRNNQESEAHQRGRDHYRLQTLIIEWASAPGARWALNVEGTLLSLPKEDVRLPDQEWDRFHWELDGDQKCTLIYENDNPKASLKVGFHARHDHVDYSLTVHAEDDLIRDHLTTHLCFNHAWADGFGRDALVLTDDRIRSLSDISNPERIWIRTATLAEEPAYAQLKSQQYFLNGTGGNLNRKRIIGSAAEVAKIPAKNVQGKFIATQFRGEDSATVAINSPNAIAVGWSFWPCTDIDLSFGTVRPREPKTVSGKIWFLKEGIDTALKTIRIGNN